MCTLFNRTHTTHSAEETLSLGCSLGKELTLNTIICFFGELAAGKTTFIKGVTKGAANFDPNQVSSPTFSYLNIYRGSQTIYHFDLYRLKGSDEFMSMGFDEMFECEGICCIEWAEKIASICPYNCIHITMEHIEDNKRTITIRRQA